MPLNETIRVLITKHPPGHALAQQFYCDPGMFSLDREKILDQSWHIAGHTSRIPDPGDYFLFNLCGEEIIILRGKDDNLHAHYNVCRHRGSRICLESEGRKSTLVCPYHAWTYNLDGSLRVARLMNDDFNVQDYGLHSCHVRVVEGLIFISLGENPVDIDEATKGYAAYLQFHGINDAKIARRMGLPTHANWKLLVENFIECYHCTPAHPEYSAVHSELKLLAAGAGLGSGPDDACREFQTVLDNWLEEIKSLDNPYPEIEMGEESPVLRLPIKEGYLTESQNGKPVAPLMGQFKEYDGGVTNMAFNYLNYMIASNDHALLLRFTPVTEILTDVEAVWLVNGTAEEGVDYDPAKVSWVWDVTLKQDAIITENNQAGIFSSRYQPGHYSEQEVMNRNFTQWYLDQLSA